MKNLQTTNIYYVYLHKRKDNNKIFYVGKGKLNRFKAINHKKKHTKESKLKMSISAKNRWVNVK